MQKIAILYLEKWSLVHPCCVSSITFVIDIFAYVPFGVVKPN